MVHYEACCHQFTSHLHTLNQVKEFLHLLHVYIVWSLRPATLALRDVVDVTPDYRVALLNVEPPGIPSFQRSVQRYIDVLTGHPIHELQIYATDHLGTTAALLLQPEQVSEEVEIWKNAQIRFAEVDEDRDVQNGISVEIA